MRICKSKTEVSTNIPKVKKTKKDNPSKN